MLPLWLKWTCWFLQLNVGKSAGDKLKIKYSCYIAMLTASINAELVQVNERWTSQIASKSKIKSYPMYGIFTYIYHTFKPYSIHGSNGILNQNTVESIVHMFSQSPGQPGNPPKENSYKKSTFSLVFIDHPPTKTYNGCPLFGLVFQGHSQKIKKDPWS